MSLFTLPTTLTIASLASTHFASKTATAKPPESPTLSPVPDEQTKPLEQPRKPTSVRELYATLTLHIQAQLETLQKAQTQLGELLGNASSALQALVPQIDAMGGLIFRDKLTGLHNRSEFDEDIEALYKDNQKQSQPFAIYFFDMDKFKPLNDIFGHAFGDVVLQHTGGILLTGLKPGMKAYRYGGEELVVIAKDLTKEEALSAGTAWLGNINQTQRRKSTEQATETQQRDTEINSVLRGENNPNARDLSFSMGLLYFNGQTPLPAWVKKAEDLTKAANVLEHLAKEKGRNQMQVLCLNELAEAPTLETIHSLKTQQVLGPKGLKLPS